MPIQHVSDWLQTSLDNLRSLDHAEDADHEPLRPVTNENVDALEQDTVSWSFHQNADGNGAESHKMDRQAIIKRIKERGLARQRALSGDDIGNQEQRSQVVDERWVPQTLPVLMPSPTIKDASQANDESFESWTAAGLQTSRPKSALHKGDFREESRLLNDASTNLNPSQRQYPTPDFAASSPPAPWHDSFSRARRHEIHTPSTPIAASVRPRTASIASLFKSFSYQAPTSPLVQQANAEDLLAEVTAGQGFALPGESIGKRRTFSPASLQSSNRLGERSFSVWSSSPPTLRRESSLPYQAHQPRRSIGSLHGSPTPYLGSRRTSMVGSSPMQYTMVGSFEESILHGRMSSTPSKPLDFTASIGVLGIGKCKPHLKCPPHVTIPFAAVFYSYGYGKDVNESQPSPYVGTVDLRSSAGADARPRPKRRRVHKQDGASTAADATQDLAHTGPVLGEEAEPSIDAPRGGYRIPAKGQLQIIIKNPNKTAVKLFLIPYDVTDIKPGQKTFIRQRSYSPGPLLDIPPSRGKGLDDDQMGTAIADMAATSERPVLRYLIQLHICCTGKGRIYLHNNMRVVFANRVPDGKERLRNEIQLPDPKFSTYRPETLSTTSTPVLRAQLDYADAATTFDESVSPIASSHPRGAADHQQAAPKRQLPIADLFSGFTSHRQRPSSAVRSAALEVVASRPESRNAVVQGTPVDTAVTEPDTHASGVRSPTSPLSPLSQLQRPVSPVTTTSEGSGSFTFSRSSSSEALQVLQADGLLARRLRELDVTKRRGWG